MVILAICQLTPIENSMEKVPADLLDKFLDKSLDKDSLLDQLTTLIESGTSVSLRISAIDIINRIRKEGINFGAKSDIIFQVFENLLISDSSEAIRSAAASFLSGNFEERTFNPMLWALYHEISPATLAIIIEALVNYIIKSVHLNLRFLENNVQDIDFKVCIEEQSMKNITKIKDIMINYLILIYLKKVFWRLKYKIQECHIVSLDFTFKELTVFPESLKYLQGLKRLILKYNQLTKIPRWIDSLNSLDVLNLNVNNINEIPSTIGGLQWLKELSLWKNELNYLPESISELNNLEILNLRLNNLEFLPESLGNLGNLKILNLHDNKLTKVPESIVNLIKLENLNLSWNLLKALPISLTKLSSLEYLDLERNDLEQVPDDLSNMHSLKYLNLSDNNLKKFPENIKFPKGLKILNISRNNLTSFPKELIQLEFLEEIYVGQNNFKEPIGDIQTLKEKNVKIIE